MGWPAPAAPLTPRAECPLDGQKDKVPRTREPDRIGRQASLWPSAAYAKIAKMKISREDVVRVAELAYLELSETELETYRAQIDEILEYIGKLNELDTANVEPMAQVLTLDQTADATLREDTVAPCGIAAEILPQAPDPDPPFFRVPKVIER
jgi:aspartyl-tRNA(Asn)/glutamyl-tRNA(Gln) amidotransferase subunit C